MTAVFGTPPEELAINNPPALDFVVERLFSAECLEYRAEFNTRLKAYVRELIEGHPLLEAGLQGLLDVDNLALPCPGLLGKLRHTLNIIAASVVRGDSVSLLVADPSLEASKREGTGKTAIVSKLMGIEVPYDAFKPVPTNEQELKVALGRLRSMEKIRVAHSNKELKILTSDMPFVGINEEGVMVACPPQGEYLVSMWDLGRHIMRVIDPNYYPGKRRKDMVFRAYQKEVSKGFYFDFDLFADFSKAYRVTSIFMVTRPDKGELRLDRVPAGGVLQQLRAILEDNPLYHESTFWRLNKDVHLERANRMLNFLEALEEDSRPAIYKLAVPAGGRRPIEEASTLISRFIP